MNFNSFFLIYNDKYVFSQKVFILSIMELILDLNKRYTYADYLTWADDKVRELVDGFIKMMSPKPRPFHQVISLSIGAELMYLLKKHKGKCKVYPEIDVRFPKNGEKEDSKIYTVVSPDISVVCDPSKIDEKGCLGAPDLIV